MSSVYASIDGGDETSLKVLLINKNQNSSKTAALEINSDAVFQSSLEFGFKQAICTPYSAKMPRVSATAIPPLI